MKSTMEGRPRGPERAVTIVDPIDLDRMRWQPVSGCPGVRVTQLWQEADEVCALIAYEPGAGTPGLPHPDAEHHIWVLSGLASVDGREIVAGSYLHVPSGVAHPIVAVGALGCTLLQIHRRGRTAASAEPPN